MIQHQQPDLQEPTVAAIKRVAPHLDGLYRLTAQPDYDPRVPLQGLPLPIATQGSERTCEYGHEHYDFRVVLPGTDQEYALSSTQMPQHLQLENMHSDVERYKECPCGLWYRAGR